MKITFEEMRTFVWVTRRGGGVRKWPKIGHVVYERSLGNETRAGAPMDR